MRVITIISTTTIIITMTIILTNMMVKSISQRVPTTSLQRVSQLCPSPLHTLQRTSSSSSPAGTASCEKNFYHVNVLLQSSIFSNHYIFYIDISSPNNSNHLAVTNSFAPPPLSQEETSKGSAKVISTDLKSHISRTLVLLISTYFP